MQQTRIPVDFATLGEWLGAAAERMVDSDTNAVLFISKHFAHLRPNPYDAHTFFITHITDHLTPEQVLMVLGSQDEQHIRDIFAALSIQEEKLDPNNMNRRTLVRYLLGAYLAGFADFTDSATRDENPLEKMLFDLLRAAAGSLSWKQEGATVTHAVLYKQSYYHFEAYTTREQQDVFELELHFGMPGKTHIATYARYPTLAEAQADAYVLLVKWLRFLIEPLAILLK